MSTIRIDGEDFVVEAEELARAFGMDPAAVIRNLREGHLTSRREKGIDAHEGLHRLTFSHEGRVLRLTLAGDGRVLSRAVFARAPGRAAEPSGAGE